MKRASIATIAIFLVWTILAILLHGKILSTTYQATAQLWRPMPEMKMGLMHLTRFLVATGFVAIYAWFIQPKSVGRGLGYGALWGFAGGVSMGYGSYAYMPIPYHLAFAWFAGTLVTGVVAGYLVGLIVRR